MNRNPAVLGHGSRGPAYTLHGAPAGDHDLYVRINSQAEDRTFTVQEGQRSEWRQVVDTARPEPDDIMKPLTEPPSGSAQYPVRARSVVVLRRNFFWPEIRRPAIPSPGMVPDRRGRPHGLISAAFPAASPMPSCFQPTLPDAMNNFDLKKHQLDVKEIHRNLPPGALYEHAIRFGKDASIAENGGLDCGPGVASGIAPALRRPDEIHHRIFVCFGGTRDVVGCPARAVEVTICSGSCRGRRAIRPSSRMPTGQCRATAWMSPTPPSSHR